MGLLTPLYIPPLSRKLLSTKKRWQDRAKMVLSAMQIVNHKRLIALVSPPPLAAHDLIKDLQELATIIGGVWIVQTRHLPITSPRQKLIREYLLSVLACDGFIKRKQVAEECAAPPQSLLYLLRPITTLDPDLKVWRVKLEKDLEFEAEFPDFCAAHQNEWRTFQPKIISELLLTRKTKSSTRTRAVSTVKAESSTASASLPAVVGVSKLKAEDVFEVPTAKEQLRRLVRLSFQESQVITPATMQKRFQEYQNKDFPSNQMKELTTSDLTLILHEEAEEIQNRWILKNIGDPEVDNYRRVILRVFKNGKTGKLRKADVVAAANEAGFKIPQKSYREILKEIANTKGSQWVLKNGI